MPQDHPTIGVLVSYVGHHYYASLLHGVHRAARARGARVIAFQTAGADYFGADGSGPDPLADGHVDGWISGLSDPQTERYCEGLVARGKPLVTMNARLAVPGACAVLPGNFDGVRAAVRHLVGHGHTRIAFAAAFTEHDGRGAFPQIDIRERYEAYLETLREAGIAPDPELVFSLRSNMEMDGRALARRFISSGLPATAIVLGTDRNAIGLVDEIQRGGFRVPEDLAVVGFDDIPRAQHITPPLATVALPFEAVSSCAAEVLLDHLVDGVPFPEVVRVAAPFVARRSCGCVRRPRATLLADSVLAEHGVAAAARPALITAVACGREVPRALEGGLRAAAAELANHLQSAFEGDRNVPDEGPREAWSVLLDIGRDMEAAENLLSLVEDLASAWSRDADAATKAHARAVCHAARLSVLRGSRSLEQNRQVLWDTSLEALRMMNAELIGSSGERSLDLSWLRWMRTRVGALCEWTPAAEAHGARRLHVTSVFASDAAAPPAAVGSEFAVADFPPLDMVRMLDASPDCVLSIVPLTRKGRNRGLLAVVAPIEVETADQAFNLSHWVDLLAASLDREELVSSLRSSEERYALAASAANDGLWDWNVETGHVYFSPRWKAMLGYLEREIGSDLDAWFALVHGDDLPALKAALESHRAGNVSHLQHEYRIVHKDGRRLWMLARGVVIVDQERRVMRMAGSQTDVTARREAEEQLRRNALYDTLTGLPNRALLIDRLDQAIARYRCPPQARFAVVFLDLDDFKTVNDSLGHLSGDQLLVQIAHRLTAVVRPTDTVARLGGDEFAIITDVDDDAHAVETAERIQEALRAPFDIGAHRVVPSASVGITLASERCTGPEDYLRDADTAMYSAKAQGRARHQLFDLQMHERVLQRLSLESGIRRALERHEFVLHYQPFVSLQSLDVVGVEALIRWSHPERGLLPPQEFLPAAEESGLILAISEWVLQTACEQARRWQDVLSRSVRINVNVHPLQLLDIGFAAHVADSLQRRGLKPRALGVELVEGTLIDNRPAILENLQKLRTMGVHISIDDFGTGYSSLSYLKRLPLDTLKIDRSFIQGVPHDMNDVSISTTIIAMARSLNMSVVAEGVETTEQADFLRSQGCEKAQGYLFSRPLSAEACEAFIEGGQPGVARALAVRGKTTHPPRPSAE